MEYATIDAPKAAGHRGSPSGPPERVGGVSGSDPGSRVTDTTLRARAIARTRNISLDMVNSSGSGLTGRIGIGRENPPLVRSTAAHLIIPGHAETPAGEAAPHLVETLGTKHPDARLASTFSGAGPAS